jgi:hypothetical protein
MPLGARFRDQCVEEWCEETVLSRERGSHGRLEGQRARVGEQVDGCDSGVVEVTKLTRCGHATTGTAADPPPPQELFRGGAVHQGERCAGLDAAFGPQHQTLHSVVGNIRWRACISLSDP